MWQGMKGREVKEGGRGEDRKEEGGRLENKRDEGGEEDKREGIQVERIGV